MTTSYTYNGDGDRVSQTVGTTTTTYVLDIATPLTMVLAETTGTSTIRYLHGLDLVAQSDGTSTEYFAYDGLGSVRQVLDAARLPLLTQTFDPYGNPYRYTGPTESVTSYGYSGEYQDSNGLVFLRARYYNPAQGRFGQMDPSRREKNLYQYGFSNPVKYVDPAGTLPCDNLWWNPQLKNQCLGAIQGRLVTYAIGARVKGYSLASDFMLNYLFGNGANFWVDPNRLPDSMKAYMNERVNNAIQASSTFKRYFYMDPCDYPPRSFIMPIAFDIPFTSEGPDAFTESGIGLQSDYYFAFGGGGFHYRSAGVSTGLLKSLSGSRSKFTISVPVEIYDHYDWCQSDNACGANNIHFYDQITPFGVDIGVVHTGEFFALERAGMAKQFHIFSGWTLKIEIIFDPNNYFSTRIKSTKLDHSQSLPFGGPGYISINPLQEEEELEVE